jgi:rhomboid protease GluP
MSIFAIVMEVSLGFVMRGGKLLIYIINRLDLLKNFESNIIKMLKVNGYQEVAIKDEILKNITDDRKYVKYDNHMVNFVNGDSLTEKEMIDITKSNFKFLSAIKAEYYCVVIQVFVFEENLDDEKKKFMKKLYEEIPEEKKFLITTSVILKSTKINYYFNRNKIKEKFFDTLKDLLKYDVENLTNEDVDIYIKEHTLVILDIKPYVTYTILGINIILSIILFVLTTKTTHKFAWEFHEVFLEVMGAKFNALIDQGEYWRWITPIFLHASIFHLISNSIGILIFGRMVEITFGRKKMIIIYLFSGFLGVLGSYIWAPVTISVGASGAIFGLLGALLVLSKKYKNTLNRGFESTIWVLIIVNLFMGLTAPNIDNAAHLGGLIGGVIISKFVGAGKKSIRLKKFRQVHG